MTWPEMNEASSDTRKDTVFASFARFNPMASSLPRAASWDRNITGTFIDAQFDQNGVLVVHHLHGCSRKCTGLARPAAESFRDWKETKW